MARFGYSFSASTVSSPALGERIVYRPRLPVLITASNGRSVRFSAILDTGADDCVFPLSVARLLQMDLARMRTDLTVGVGSEANETLYETLHLGLDNGIGFLTQVGFTPGLDALGVGLLGQNGFFDRFNVEFRHKDRIFIIEPA